MSDGYVSVAIDELPDLWDGFARLVREGTGISAFGVQIMNLPPDSPLPAPPPALRICPGSSAGRP